jgi:hypothetical protein
MASEPERQANRRIVGSGDDPEDAILDEDLADALVDEVGAEGGDKGMGGRRPCAGDARKEAEASDMRADPDAKDNALARVSSKGKEARVRAEVSRLDAGPEKRSQDGWRGRGVGMGDHEKWSPVGWICVRHPAQLVLYGAMAPRSREEGPGPGG